VNCRGQYCKSELAGNIIKLPKKTYIFWSLMKNIYICHVNVNETQGTLNELL